MPSCDWLGYKKKARIGSRLASTESETAVKGCTDLAFSLRLCSDLSAFVTCANSKVVVARHDKPLSQPMIPHCCGLCAMSLDRECFFAGQSFKCDFEEEVCDNPVMKVL